jgi:hypothetical protein
MSTSYGDETVIIPAANGAAPTPPAPGGPLFGMTASQEAQYALDLGLGPDHLKGDARAEYDRLAKLREYHAQHPQPDAAPPPPGPQPGGQDGSIDPDELARFRVHQAQQAAVDEAKRGNGSDSAFMRWLTRKPLPVKMTTYRVMCGLCWAFWTFLFAVATIAAPGFGHVICFVLAVLCGLYDYRIWTRRASYLTIFIVF